MSYFQKQGRALLGNGYLIIPVKPGHKRPALAGWQNARMGAADLSSYAGHGVGILCGQGAHPVAAIDIDTLDAQLAQRFAAWCHENLGMTCERVGQAPKVLLPYRAAQAGWGKAASAWFDDEFGDAHRVEVLGKGQQFVAYHVHPDTEEPYYWTDMLGGLEYVRADALPVLTEDQVVEALAVFESMAESAGLIRRESGQGKVPKAPRERTPACEEDFFGRVNEAALAGLGAWVPVLFPSAREYRDGGFRVSSADLHRSLEEDLSIVPDGIVDFGVADMGDERMGKRTPIDLVLEWAPAMFDDPLDAPVTPFDAALWLCDCLGAPKESLGFGLRREREREAERQARRLGLAALLERVEACDDSIELLDTVAREARELLATVPVLHAEVAAAFKARFKELTDVTLPAGDLARALREPRAPTALSRRPLTEFGNAERMLDRYGQGLMFVPELSAWFVWTGVYWRQATGVEVEHLAKETVKALVNEIDDHPEPAEFFKFCAISQQAKMVRSMIQLAQSDPRVMVPAAELDKHAHLMGAANGVIDLTNGELLAPDPELRITRVVGCDYVPGALAPLFEQTVAEVFNGDADVVEFFQRLVGYAATGNPTQDVMVIPFGNGSNGKSTVLGAVRRAFGGYARAAEAGTFISNGKGGSNAGGAREDLLRLKGARFVYVNEPDEGGELREGSVKSMTGGDAITARGLYSQNTVEIVPSWVVFMPTNHKPIVKGSDNGIWRRLLLLPFTRNFEADPSVKKDPAREAKLQKELPGILSWIVRGALEYQRRGLNPAGSVLAARDEYREDMDLLAEWLNECCEIRPDGWATNAQLWGSWEDWSKARGEFRFIQSNRMLVRRLASRFEQGKGTGGVRGFYGLTVKEELV